VSEQVPSSSRGGHDLATELHLRPERPPVTRLSRKVLMGLAAVTVIAIFAALILGLYQRRKPRNHYNVSQPDSSLSQ
jgi:hypothetical protein